MINADLFQFNQISLFVFLVALVGVIRERTVLPYLLVVLGSFLHGAIPAALIASIVLWIRFDGDAPKWLRLKDAMAMFFIVAASAVPSPYREFMICMGALSLSMHFELGKLGVVPALLLVHLYLGETIPLEFVLGASGGYIVISEILKLSKSPHEKRILQWIELPAILGILYPLKDYFMTWIDDEILLGVGISFAAIVMILLVWIKLKRPDFSEIYDSIHSQSNRVLGAVSGLVSNRLSWVQESRPEESMKLDLYFDRLFWGLIAIFAAWAILVLLYKGGIV
jgi:hypothetical protein